jgi:Protein of unknown function (DUF2950)
MKTAFVSTVACLCLTTTAFVARAQEPTGTAGTVVATRHFRTFSSPERAGDALVAAAAKFDVDRLEQLFGPSFRDVVLSGDDPQDRERVAEFVAKADAKTVVSVDPNTHSRAFLLVGSDEWKFPIPIVRHGGRWLFDTEAGKQEIIDRRATRALDARAQETTGTAGTVVATGPVRTFDSPQRAGDALVAAAAQYDVNALEQMFGPEFKNVVLSGESAQDQQRAAEFVAKAEEKTQISIDPKTRTRAFLLVGNDDWPFPIPIVKRGTKWSFDTAAGRQEILYRRIGANELDAIAIARGYVEAQHEYGLKKREGYDVNQYAQRIISTPGTQDGLAWQNADGTWDGPVGEKVAEAIQKGYSSGEPYHGYFFKVLKGQGPAAPLGQMDFVVKGVMIGGFALAAAPAEYGKTGVKTFIVSHDGVVYEKDLGPTTVDQFMKMERFNPDMTWKPVAQDPHP